MVRALIVLRTIADRLFAVARIQQAPDNTRVEIKGARRTLSQNDKMWATLTDISRQVKWCGQWLTTDDWKLMFLDSLHRQSGRYRVVPNLDGNGYVNLNQSSRDLSVGEMADMITMMHAFGADPEHPVVFGDAPVPAREEVS